MALFKIPSVRIAGIASAVPKYAESNFDYSWLTQQERELLVKTTGVEFRRIAKEGITTSDLCFESAQKLIAELNWNKNDIEVLVFVSQSRDYILPATSVILQDRLGLPKSCLALDVGLGCSGYVYGLSTIAAQISAAGLKKGLLLVGDISTASLNFKDKSTYPLFGDSGTATALERNEQAANMVFNLQSDGEGYQSIIIRAGGLREPFSDSSFREDQIDKGVVRRRMDLELNGLDVFNFSLREVPTNVSRLLEYCGLDVDKIDQFVFHQANLLMNETIRKKLKISPDKYPYSINEFGNTSSASIPLTCTTRLSDQLQFGKSKLIFSGFGVGLSWGSVFVETENICCPDLIEVP